MSNRLKIGLFLDMLTVPAWAFAMIERILEDNQADITTALMNSGSVDKNSIDKKTLLYRLFDTIERKIVKVPNDPDKPKDLRKLFPHISPISFDPSSFDDLETLRNTEIDLLFHLGSERLHGDILKIPRLGVWAYHHGDHRQNRGEPTGFWEVIDENIITGITLKRLAEDIDDDIILARSHSPTHTPLVHRNRYYYLWKSVVIFPRELQRFVNMGEEAYWSYVNKRNNAIEFYDREPYQVPSNLEFLRRYSTYMLRYLWGKLFRVFTNEQWILFYDLRDSISKSLWRYKPLIPPKDRLWADPHIVYKDDNYYVFMEELLFETNRGHISVIEIDKDGNTSEPYRVLERPYHLSYPFIFSYQDSLYMLPETSANQTIEIYEATEFPITWKSAGTLMDNVVAVDTTLLFHDDLWWMFTTIQEEIAGSMCDELHIFFSDNPLSQNWRPHPHNPVITDARRARPAGAIFEHNNILYRPSQDDTQLYGYGVRINQILDLSTTNYKEQEIDFLEPLWNKRVKGLHTFNVAGKLSIIDAYTRIRKI